MVGFVNQIVREEGFLACQQIIVSGGVSNFLDGFYHTEKLQLPSIYGQASAFLKHATGSYDDLKKYITAQIDGFRVAKAMLKIRQ
jgi:isopentenyl-diphosphate Delta-isomerase